MEVWQLDFEWLQIRHRIKESMNQEKLPDLNSILLLIGIQESGIVKKKYEKQEKEDLMHVAVCTLLSIEGYFTFKGNDHDGWPHFEQLKSFDIKGEKDQEQHLIGLVVKYFSEVNPL